MKFSASRIGPGSYEYRGFDIVSQYSEGYGQSWFVTPTPDGPFEDVSVAWHLDPGTTLRGAKVHVDYFHSNHYQ